MDGLGSFMLTRQTDETDQSRYLRSGFVRNMYVHAS